ncbi:MAG: MFS transporter [Candidatus Rokubacteria bacterium]|nr:MFS transporter [Candidatus Rokubacteria bacterium]
MFTTARRLAWSPRRTLPLAAFVGTFAWSFVYVSLPFYVQRISTADPVSTLRWTGWILGISSLVTVVTAPVWGRLAERGNPKAFYVVVEILQGVGFVGMALARTLIELFFARFMLGTMGAASTFAFIMAGRSRDGDVRREVSAIQSAMTVGQILGPLAGAVAAARIGFVPSFLLGGAILWGCAGLVQWGVPRPDRSPAGGDAQRRPSWREVTTACVVVLAGSIQVFFLTAVLPQILPPLGVAFPDTLEIGGLVIFASGVAAALGSLAAPRLADLIGEWKTVAWFLAFSSGLLALLGLTGDVWSFGVMRFLQVLCVAPVFPLVVARIAQRAGGGAIGLVNSSRIGAAFIGPVVATTLLAWTNPSFLYVLLAVPGLACLPLVRPPRASRPGGVDGTS